MALGAEDGAFDLVGGGDVGVVCVHGFTGTPWEVRYLGEQLARAGFQVHGPRLPGHGTSLAELDATTWQDWANAVEDAFDTLRLLCRKVVVVGQSLGGLLALHLASRRPDVAAVASLAAPLWLDGLAGRVARWAETGSLERLTRLRSIALRTPFGIAARPTSVGLAIPKFSGSDVRDRRARAANPCYDAIPLRALGQLAAFMRVVDGVLPDLRQPLLVLHAQHDHTAPVGCAYHIAQRGRAQRTRILPRSYHLLAVDVERDIVAAEVIDFVRRTTRPTAHTGDLACAT